MRDRLIGALKNNKELLSLIYNFLRKSLNAIDVFVPKKKAILFTSFGGRNMDDSPYALYKKFLGDNRFNDYELIWAFTNPDNHTLNAGKKIRIDTPEFFRALLSSRIWISNAGIDRGIELSRKRHISVETWHGTPLKKIGDDSNDETALNENKLRKQDDLTIRCAQSDYDLEILSRVLNAKKDSFLMSDLPRNDILLDFTETDRQIIRNKLNIPENKKIILYMPTYREFQKNADNAYYLAPPINMSKWEDRLSDQYILLVRAHYAVSKSLNIKDDSFVKNVSKYEPLNELYAICDIFISDYSSSFVDFSIMEKPMLCFPYDYDLYKKNRGLYIDLETELPCKLCFDEDTLIKEIEEMDYPAACQRTKSFHEKYAPNAGNACAAVLEEIYKRLNH